MLGIQQGRSVTTQKVSTRLGVLWRRAVATAFLVSAAIGCLLGPGAVAAGAYEGPYSPCKTTSYPVNEHCYAISDWQMKDGSSSGVNGLTAEIEPSQAYVPGWQEYNFATQEMWTAFRDISGGCAWNETGVVTGYDYNETTDRPFYAWDNGCESRNFSGVFFVPNLNIGYGNYFWVESLYYAPGKWEQWIEGAGPFDTGAEMPGGADNPEIGMEQTSTKIIANGNSVSTTWEKPSGEWQAAWYDPYSIARRVTPGADGQDTAPTCAEPNTGWPGNLSWTSYPDPKASCFYGDNENYENALSGGGMSEEFPSGEPTLTTPAGQQPPIMASDWKVTVATGPLLTQEQLKEKARSLAAADGDASPTSTEAVRTNEKTAVKTADSGLSLPSTSNTTAIWAEPLAAGLASETYLVVMKGHFASSMSVPAGDVSPTGSVLEAVFDAHTGALDAIFLGKEVSSTSLSSVGKVMTLE